MANDELSARAVKWHLQVLVVCSSALLWAVAAWAELPAEIRVLTYNIHHGEGVDSKIDLPRIAKVIESVSPHIVALQEVDQGVARTERVDQPAELARLTGMKVVFGRNIDYQGGGYGTAVLTKLPIKAAGSEKIPPFYEGTAQHPEQRAVQVVELGSPGEPGLVFLGTHLDYRPDDRERMASVELINGLASKYADRLMLLAGDLNATPESRVLAELGKRWTLPGNDKANLFTYPSAKPEKQIDYVLYRPAERWRLVEVRVLEEPVASDHRPVLVVLRPES